MLIIGTIRLVLLLLMCTLGLRNIDLLSSICPLISYPFPQALSVELHLGLPRLHVVTSEHCGRIHE